MNRATVVLRRLTHWEEFSGAIQTGAHDYLAGLDECRPELDRVELFEVGVEPDNAASRRCLETARLP